MSGLWVVSFNEKPNYNLEKQGILTMTLHPFLHVLYHMITVLTLLLIAYKLFNIGAILKTLVELSIVNVATFSQLLDMLTFQPEEEINNEPVEER